MMTATDRLLKRPAVPLRRMSDIRFLLIILEVNTSKDIGTWNVNNECFLSPESLIGAT